MITNKAIVIALIAVLICILIMILCVLFLLGHSGKRNGKSKTKKRKAKKRVVKKPSSGNASRPGRGSSSAGPKTESGNKLPALKAQTDDDMQKYAEITKSYLSSKYGAEIKVAGLKRYFSDRHGFDCIDFTYRLDTGMAPAAFRQAMNQLDTALSNVSGVDTLTFPVDGSAEGLYRTTFYLGK